MKLENKNPVIICICGKARSGKNSVANYLKEYFTRNKNSKVIISPYSKYIKQYISEITNTKIDDTNKPRDLLQQLSSELIKGKLNNQNFFINRQIEDIDIYSYFFHLIIIPDVRFEKEIECLKERYPKVISIAVKRENFDNGLTETQKNDITETALDNYTNYDYIIFNTGNLEKLYNDTLNIIKDIERKT